MNLLRAFFDPDVRVSGVAMVRDIPRGLQLKQVDESLFFTEESGKRCRHRIERATLQSPRQSGTMNVGRMLHYLNLACGGSLGF